MTYEALATRFDLPAQGSQLGAVLSPILCKIATWCAERHLPPLTVLVVRKSGADEGLPGQGFWDLLGMPGYDRAKKITAFGLLSNQVYEFWAQ